MGASAAFTEVKWTPRYVAGPKRGRRVWRTYLRSGRGCGSSAIDRPLEPPTAIFTGERGGWVWLKFDSFTTPRPLWGPRDRGNCSFVKLLGTTDREASGGKKRNKGFSARPSSGEGVVRSPSPEEHSSPSLGRPSQGRLLLRLPPGLAGAWTGGAAALRPAPRCCLAGGCCVCCVGAGAGCAWLPQSASVQRRTAGRSSPPRRRRGRSGTQGHSGPVPCLPPSCRPDTARGGVPRPIWWTSHGPETAP